MEPVNQNPPQQAASQPGASAVQAQLNHAQPPAGPEAAPPALPPKPARWGVMIGRFMVLLVKIAAYAAFSPFILCYAATYIIGGYVAYADFSGKDVKEGMGDLFKPITSELRNIVIGYMGYASKRDYVDEMRKAYSEVENQKKAAQAAQSRPQSQPPVL